MAVSRGFSAALSGALRARQNMATMQLAEALRRRQEQEEESRALRMLEQELSMRQKSNLDQEQTLYDRGQNRAVEQMASLFASLSERQKAKVLEQGIVSGALDTIGEAKSLQNWLEKRKSIQSQRQEKAISLGVKPKEVSGVLENERILNKQQVEANISQSKAAAEASRSQSRAYDKNIMTAQTAESMNQIYRQATGTSESPFSEGFPITSATAMINQAVQSSAGLAAARLGASGSAFKEPVGIQQEEVEILAQNDARIKSYFIESVGGVAAKQLMGAPDMDPDMINRVWDMTMQNPQSNASLSTKYDRYRQGQRLLMQLYDLMRTTSPTVLLSFASIVNTYTEYVVSGVPIEDALSLTINSNASLKSVHDSLLPGGSVE